MNDNYKNNEKIIRNLELLCEKEKAGIGGGTGGGANRFKYKAYINALKAIKELGERGVEIKSVDDVEGIPGIGKGIKEKIGLMLENKFIAPEVKMVVAVENDVFSMLCNIYGVGEKKARELMEKDKISDLLTLKERQDELLNEKQKIGLKYYNALLERIPQGEMVLHHKFIKGIWDNDYHCRGFDFRFEIVGSYRRGEKTSGDIDVLITFDESLNLMGRMVYTLKRNNYVIETLAEGPKKFMGICRLPGMVARRIDIIWCGKEEYPFALLYFTGSDKYNRWMREMANRRGYRLNEKKLVGITAQTAGVKLPYFEKEKDIVEFLGLEYLEPCKRG